MLFLRAHPEVVRLAVRGASGEPLLLTGRRGGVPVLWVSTSPTGSEGAAQAADRPRLFAEMAFEGRGRRRARGGDGPLATPRSRRVGCGDPRRLRLLPPHRLPGQGARAKRPSGWRPDPTRRVFPPRPASRRRAGPFRPPGGSRCTLAEDAAVAGIESLSARYRTTLFLNVAVMGLALLLGGVGGRRSPASRAGRGADARGCPGAGVGAPALPRGKAHHGGAPRGGHRPRDQQSARGDGQLPEPRPRRPRARRRRGRAPPPRRREGGPRAGGPGRAAGARPRRPRAHAAQPGGHDAGIRGDDGVRPVARRVLRASGSRRPWGRSPWWWKGVRSCWGRWP